MITLQTAVTIGLYLAEAALGAAILVALVMIWSFIKEEWIEFWAMSRAEKRWVKEWDDQMFTKWCREEKIRYEQTLQGLVRV